MTEPDGSHPHDAEIQGFPQPRETSDLQARLPIERLATQFVAELRDGQEPDVEDYARRYPLLAEEINDYFPMLRMMEEMKVQNEATTLRESVPQHFDIKTLGRCRMLQEIARGGMGVIFEAVRPIGQRVAIKLLPHHTAAIPGWKERFMHEARTASQLRHKNILRIDDYGEEEESGHCYYEMELVRGVGFDWLIGRLIENGQVDAVDILNASHRPMQVHEIDTDCEIPIELLAGLENVDDEQIAGSFSLAVDDFRGMAELALQATRGLGYAHHRGVLAQRCQTGQSDD